MPALERRPALRVAADPAALDAARWAGPSSAVEVLVLRIAPDEAIGVGAESVEVGDPHAIVEPERGLMGAVIGDADWHGLLHHVEWRLPDERPALAQGSVAGVPARLYLGDREECMLFCAAAQAHVLAERLGWST